MRDDLFEIYQVINKNKLRTSLTGFSIAWGMFVFITLLGLGNGLKTEIFDLLKDVLNNMYQVESGSTTLIYEGLSQGRQIKLQNEDYNFLIQNYPKIDLKSPELNQSGFISFQNHYKPQTLQGVSSDMIFLKNIKLNEGRFINKIDVNEKRKVIVISSTHKKIFFHNKKAIGKYLKFKNTLYLIIGIYDDKFDSMETLMYIPYTTIQSIYKGDSYDKFYFTMVGAEDINNNNQFITEYRQKMSKRLQFDPKDHNALKVYSMSEDFHIANNMVLGLTFFIWIIGVSTLLSGIMGINNITMISVKERTKEFAIKRTLGAKPFTIIKSIMIESTLVSIAFGYLGVFLGVLILHLTSWMFLEFDHEGFMSLLNKPSVDINIVVSASILLIIIGIVAGFYPAKKALSISIIKAINEE
jgi:putative ABC transport system permease protein